jgi:hypothetical protein
MMLISQNVAAATGDTHVNDKELQVISDRDLKLGLHKHKAVTLRQSGRMRNDNALMFVCEVTARKCLSRRNF